MLGAIIDLGVCFDLLDKKWLDFLGKAYLDMEIALSEAGKDLLSNTSFNQSDFDFKKRELDCAVIRYAVLLAQEKGISFDSVRAAFWEGKALYPNAGFKTHNHIQLSVINLNCIKGLFLPHEKVDSGR